MFKRLAILLLALSTFASAQHISGGKTGAALPNPGSSGLCLVSTGASTYSWGACSGTSSTNWNAIVPGTGTVGTGTFNVGTGSTLTVTGSGVINSNQFKGNSTVALADGGTGQTTASGAINALVPSQATNSGKFLTTNGTSVSWGTPAGSGNTTSTTLTTNSLPKSNGANSIIDSLFTDDGTSGAYNGSGGFSVAKVSTTGSNGGLDGTEGTGAGLTAATSHDLLYPDSTAHRWRMNNNNGGALTVGALVAQGTAALGTAAIASGACATAVTVAASGVATTDVISTSFNGDPTAVTGYTPTTTGMLTIIPYPTSGNVNFKVCNLTSSSITPGAITLNWQVLR